MDMIKTILIGIFSVVSLGTSNAHALNAADLLDKYAQNQDKLSSSVIVKFECDEKIFQNNEVYTDRVAPAEVRLDGQKFFACINNKYNKVSDTNLPLVETDHITYTLWDGERGIEYYDSVGRSKAYINRQEDKPGPTFASAWPGSPLFGIRYHKAERIDTLLRQCETLSVRDEMETIGSETCYVIDAKSPTSIYTVWLNPRRGYGISHAVIKHGPGTQGAHGVLSENEDRSLTVRDVRFQQMGEVHVPMEYNLYLEERRRDGAARRQGIIHGKVTDISFNPDHEKLASFVPKMREGTRIVVTSSGIQYKWKDGMKFVVDDWNGRIRYVPKDWSILAGTGKHLPDFEDINLDISADDMTGKAILVCLFNMNQRPSRRCILELVKQSEKLKTKGIAIVAIQASKVDKEVFDSWVKKNTIPFPVGIIQGNAEQIRFRWGVRSLPWLILTDAKHTVTAEGFSLDKLNENIIEPPHEERE